MANFPIPENAILLNDTEQQVFAQLTAQLKSAEAVANNILTQIQQIAVVVGARATGKNGGKYKLSIENNFLEPMPMEDTQ